MGSATLALWLAMTPAVEPPSVEPPPHHEVPPMPDKRGRGLIGAAIGMHTLSAMGTFAAFRMIDRRCLPPGRPDDLERGTDCIDAKIGSLTLTHLGMLAGRGAIAMSAVGGDWAGEYDGARDAWAQSPTRADLRRLRVGGAAALGVGAAVMVASTAAQWVVLPRCEEQTQWDSFARCIRLTLYVGWAANVAADASLSVGAALLTYSSSYADAHRTWASRRRGFAFKVRPQISAHHLGAAASLRF